MKNHVIAELTEVELKKRETDLRDELFRLRFQHHTGQLASPIKLRTTRRELARVLTRIRELELGINQAPVQE
ncbi:MAG: 50S ribosomal protein L29 [Deltaproteobacteria bacterium]|nr:50S ribosomal protein L29 [Deltaproteobacteria bacterium]